MSRQFHRPLVIALTAALGLLVLAPVVTAQPQSARERREQRRAHKQEETKTAPLYPQATRQEPEARANAKMIKHLRELQERYEKDDWAGVVAKAEEIAAMSKAGAYDKAYAYSVAGNAAASMDDEAKAADYFAKAVAANGLDNNSHYATMYNLAVTQYSIEKYAEALATMDRFLAETKSEDPKQLGFRAALLASLERYDDAAAVYKALVEKNPTDKTLLMNAVSTLQSAEKFADANALLEKAYQQGMLTEPRELRALYVGYMNAERWDDARKMIEDGLAKGVLKPGPDLARDYQVLAQEAYFNDKLPLSIELYQRAAPMAADGEAYLNLAKVLEFAGKKSEAKAAAKKALERGVKKPEDAKRILAK